MGDAPPTGSPGEAVDALLAGGATIEPVAFPPQPLGHEDLDQLEPEQRLVAGVIRQALKDAQDPRGNELERTRAQAFLQGGGNFILLCQVGRLEPARVARLAARAQGCQFG